ncbi:cholinesterase 1-like [Strongylocentrotus purpuratus]|uniref:Carboxylic ester hydrolase n=1 Tax=Strongylocentrotus purpuratus TaxID=7668 RepID=A0A7M7SSJ9_STRPU|nr:cholinesterase 1-like [Strongylocentrotus purpuratus]
MVTMGRTHLVFLMIGLFGCHVISADPQVTLPGTSTTLSGIYIQYNESGYLNVSVIIEAFLGIPFAEPPVGELRFKNPVKMGDLGTSYPADADKSVCPQAGSGKSEDCLYLSVHTSSERPSNAPVMIWIHGGGFTGGSGSSSSYDPYPYFGLTADYVVVHINYRLGILGFLTTGDAASPGNYGMYDQVMALEWVQENIAAFGGDPSRITIMGESAGAASVGLHLLSPLSKDLFHQSIMQSGNALCPWAVDTNIDRQIGFTMEIADRVNCTTTDNQALVECLKNVEINELLAAQAALVGKYLHVELLFVPVVDGAFLPDVPLELIKRREFKSVPTLLGTNREEGTLIALRAYPLYIGSRNPPTTTLQEFRDFLPDYLYEYTPLVASAVEQWYIDWKLADDPEADQFEAFVNLQTDQVFACSTEAMARALEESGAPVFRYEMTHDPSTLIVPGWLGAGHGEDLQFVFARGLSSTGGGQTHQEKYMSVQFVRYWSNFVTSGDPNLPLSTGEYPSWPRYTLPDQDYKILSLTMKNDRAMRMDSCAFWLNYVPSLYELDESDPDDLYQDWSQEYEQWRDVHMTEWNEAFDQYKEGDDCGQP